MAASSHRVCCVLAVPGAHTHSRKRTIQQVRGRVSPGKVTITQQQPQFFKCLARNMSSLFEAKGRTCKRGTVQLARTRDSSRAKQSYTDNFHRPSHRAHRRFPEVVADVVHRVTDR
eukprot:scaffold18118_cov60-Phaeocystis_antarctica.AAC.4